MGMDYSKVSDWILREDSFDPEHLGKCEAVMALGNGYLGLRSALEESYVGETRNCFVNGTFDQADETSVTELPNVPDMTAIGITVNGCRFTLEKGTISSYARELNIRTGELKREVTWVSPKGDTVRFVFYRMVSLARLHDFAFRVEMTPLSSDTEISVKTGMDGRVTNSGSQHFTAGDKRLYENEYMQFELSTSESGIRFMLGAAHDFFLNGEPYDVPIGIYMKQRFIRGDYTVEVKKGDTLAMEKFCNVMTDRDFDAAGADKETLKEAELTDLKAMRALGYAALLKESAQAWKEQVWDVFPVTIRGNDYDQFAVRFAQYHMRIMNPAHDARMNIPGKGLTGEGYKGHCFWDTEIFLLPYYAFTHPEDARKLEEYRYRTLPGAHKKAEKFGCKGAMFPWESAWITDGEVTPEYLDVDIVTGRPNKVWSGFIEHHITADVAFGAWEYYEITGDQEFMDLYGYELIFDAAIFWVTRLEDVCRQVKETLNPATNEIEFSESKTRDGFYHICDVVGPDEYKEHKTDNAFTNYMAHWNMKKAMEYYEELKENRPDLFAALDEKMDLARYYEEWQEKADRLFLPAPNENSVLPQDSTYLTLKEIDLSKYRAQDFIGGISRDYNIPQINEIQVSKQADVLVLFFLLEDLFPRKVKEATVKYYADHTLHDSSLSYSTHAVLMADLREKDSAYEFFEKSAAIDLGPVMTTSDAGIHAAAMGGIWQGAVYGFGGLRMLGGSLRIDPVLPDEWNELSYGFSFKGQKVRATVTREEVKVVNETGREPIPLLLCGEETVLYDSLSHKIA